MSVFVATNVADVLRALTESPDAVFMAGGTDLMVEFNSGAPRSRQMTSIISVSRVAELTSWRHDPAARTLHIGAGVRWAEIEQRPIADWVPALAAAARTVGSPQIRQAGTLGGNLGTSSPAGDGLPVLAALEATVHVVSSGGRRDIPFGEFMVGPKRTALQRGELITGVTVPVLPAADDPNGWGWQGYAKVGVRNAMVISTAGVALAVDASRRYVRVALGSVGPTILRAPACEALVAANADFGSRSLSAADLSAAAALAADAASPITDHRSTAEYRRHAVGVLAGRLLRRAFPNG
jgi:CO/xanthine dehydrogenase FAD-binding subunit